MTNQETCLQFISYKSFIYIWRSCIFLQDATHGYKVSQFKLLFPIPSVRPTRYPSRKTKGK